MKKRKELNALIGLGDSKRKKTKKGSGHRLLRTEPPDSESESSSDDDEFNNLSSGANFGKRSYTQCCNVCYPLFLFIILAACVMACAGLIWMQIALKEDLDALKEKLHSMESSQKVSSSEIPKLSEDLKNKERKLDDMETGDKGLNKLWSNLTEMNRKISLLDSAVNHLKANLKSAADLISLPNTVEELQKSVATIGSTLTSVQHDVKTMQAALEKKDEDLKKTMDISDLKTAVSEANKTEELHHTQTNEQIQTLLTTVAELRQRVSSLENGSKQSDLKAAAKLAINNGSPGIQQVNEATTTKATPGNIQENSTPLAGPQTSRLPRFLTPQRYKINTETACPERVLLPGVSSMKELEEKLRQAGVDENSPGLTYQDLRKVFGTSTPSARTMQCFDNDTDQRYSVKELGAAVGL
ncbi:EF-hand calcium-binding domain-containing protein 14 [Labrus mixtus]|uniref:EF-hand calcium-binding domain-containing protein 14 n=1 Tax=Labrus mixtus TaxID=508554 RepID=UPI0029C0182E|nr:EF-hand calcium-binding domain-containing protein 14 [Labrus mixtus]